MKNMAIKRDKLNEKIKRQWFKLTGEKIDRDVANSLNEAIVFTAYVCKQFSFDICQFGFSFTEDCEWEAMFTFWDDVLDDGCYAAGNDLTLAIAKATHLCLKKLRQGKKESENVDG